MPRVVEVCPAEDLPPGTARIVPEGDFGIGVFNVDGTLCAIEDRCSHDDGPLAEGEFDAERGVVVCPRHGSEFEVCSGRPRTLPAYLPVQTYRVWVEDGLVKLEVP
jgi:3-phenylpropionate/trans-cinnamate dioxygenase ferredoxin subunit